MHSQTLYKWDENGQKDESTPLACITVDDDAQVEIRMQDGFLLFSSTLESLGYSLMWMEFPVTRPSRRALENYGRSRL